MRLFALLALTIVTSCSGAGMPQATVPPTASPSAVTPSPTMPPGALRFAIVTEGSTATVRVDEKLAINPGRTDAVLNAVHCLEGELVLLADSRFWAGAKVTMDMRRLQSDSAFRDKWVELFGPQTGRFTTAEFIPQRADGLPEPLPATGTWTFALLGTMKVRGVEHPTTWDATAQRERDTVTVSAKTIVVWSDFGIGKPVNVPEVASVADEIRLEINFTARERP